MLVAKGSEDTTIAGTKAGGLAARDTNIRKYGKSFYKEIGRIGGKKSPGPFKNNHELASRAGRKGGLTSRRTGVPNRKVDELTV